ncbi:MAG TPA: hypothetical protein VF808_11760 [Ktedonobacterales bacterium]
MADQSVTYESVVAEMIATSPATASKMFGMPCLKINGKAFAGMTEGAMVFKLAGESHGAALKLTGAHLFDPMGGRPMKEWVVVPPAHSARWLALARDAMGYVGK